MKIIAAEPLQGEGVRACARSRTATRPRSSTSRSSTAAARQRTRTVRGLRALLDEEGIFAGVSSGAVVEVAPRVAASMAPDRTSSACSPTAAGSTSRPVSGAATRTSSRGHGGTGSGGSRRALRLSRAMADEIVAHARAGLPDEACGIVSGVEATATRFHPAVTAMRARTATRSRRRTCCGSSPTIDDADDEVLASTTRTRGRRRSRRGPTWSSRSGPTRPT